MSRSFTCQNCGHCCGPIPLRDWELDRLRKTVRKMAPEIRERLKQEQRGPFACILRDKEMGKCAVYNSRPALCRLYGTTEGMACPNQPETPLTSREHGHKALGNGKFVGTLSQDIGWAELEQS